MRYSKSIFVFLFSLFFFCPTAQSATIWKKIKGGAQDVAIDDKGSVYVVSSKRKQVYRWDHYKQDWAALAKAPGNVSKIGASQKGYLFAIVQSKVYQYYQKKWYKTGDFNAFDIGVSPNGHVWAIDRRSKIAFWDKSRKKWMILKTAGTPAAGKKNLAIDVDKNNNPVMVFRDGSVIHYNVSNKKWKKLSNTKMIDLACSNGGKLYAIGYHGGIYKWNRPKQKWDKQTKMNQLNSSFNRISLLPNESPWVTLSNNNIYCRVNRVETGFLPSKHGFKFTNSFEVDETIKVDPGIFESFVPKRYYTYNIKGSYGLCGGMALAAHENYRQNRSIPSTTDAPKKGDKLFENILDRQYVSFGDPSFKYLVKAMAWWGSIEYKETLLESDTREELPDVLKSLDAKHPVQLILVYATKTTGSPWDNHQILAYAYEKTYDTIRFFVYDPNRPGRDDIVITYHRKSNNKHYLYQNAYGNPKKIFGMFPIYPRLSQ